MFANVATRQRRRRPAASATRRRRGSIAEREEREHVALVDAGRDGEEGEGQDRQADEDRQPVRPAGDDGQDDATMTASSSAVPTTTAGIGPEQRDARRRTWSRPTARRRPTGRRWPGCIPVSPVTSAHGL